MENTAEDVSTSLPPPQSAAEAARRKANRVRWLKLNFTVKAARLQTLKRQKYQHLQEEALLKARGLLQNWENGVVVLTEDLYRLAAGEREAAELMNYTPEALALRFSLRNNPYVLEAVRQLWRIDMPRDSMGCIDQRGYASVFRRIAKSLDAKAFRKKQKVDRLLNEDWKRDSKGESTMSFANFFDSIFELADLWCETIDAEDYVDFLERLSNRISHVRNGKRTLKVMKKVVPFDADSDEEEDEEGEQEEQDKSEEEANQKQLPSAAPSQSRILIAKAIRPTPQLPPSNAMHNVSRVAMSTKTINRKCTTTAARVDGKFGGATKISVAVPSPPTTEFSEPVGPTVIGSDVVAPLTPHTGTILSGHKSRQRRASVVTTIQFLDDGFVRSTSEGFSGGDTPTRILNRAPMIQATQDRIMRPSLASTAAAVLGRHGNVTATPEDRTASSAPHYHQPSARTDQHTAERKLVITVSTAKHAVLKSVVFATQARGREARADASASRTLEEQQQTPVDIESADDVSPKDWEEVSITPQREEIDENGYGKNRVPDGPAPTNTGTASSNSVAIRIRSGSTFGLEVGFTTPKSSLSTSSKSRRLGLPATAAAMRGRGGLAPLPSSSQQSGSSNVGGREAVSGKTSVPIPIIQQNSPGAVMAGSVRGFDFSESAVMKSYAIDRPTMSQLNSPIRPVTVLGPPGSAPGGIKPPTHPVQSQVRMNRDGRIKGVHVTPHQTQDVSVDPVHRDEVALSEKDKIAALKKLHESTKPEPPILDHVHRNIGHALHAVSSNHSNASTPSLPQPLVPEGDPELALHINAALDLEHAAVRPKDSHSHISHLHERYYDFTEREESGTPVVAHRAEHGMTIHSLPGSKPLPPVKKAVVKHLVDPLATPWDTFDEDENEGAGDSTSTTRNLMQSEDAREALAKVINKRASSFSAGSSRGSNGSTPTSASRNRGDDRLNDYLGVDRDEHDETESGDERKRTRSRLLSVASLGGRSVHGSKVGLTSRRLSQECDNDSDQMRESVSAPALTTMTQLEVDYGKSIAHSKQRSRTSHSSSISFPSKRRGQGPAEELGNVGDLHLIGELIQDSAISPPRSPNAILLKSSPKKTCTCSRRQGYAGMEGSTASSWPPPMYRLDHVTDQSQDTSSGSSKCTTCHLPIDSTEPTMIVNVKRELYFEPQPKEHDVLADLSQGTPSRLQMMRRRHRHTHGRP